MQTIANLNGSPLTEASNGGQNYSLLATNNPTNDQNNREIQYINPTHMELGSDDVRLRLVDTSNSKFLVLQTPYSVINQSYETKIITDSIQEKINISASEVNITGGSDYSKQCKLDASGLEIGTSNVAIDTAIHGNLISDGNNTLGKNDDNHETKVNGYLTINNHIENYTNYPLTIQESGITRQSSFVLNCTEVEIKNDLNMTGAGAAIKGQVCLEALYGGSSAGSLWWITWETGSTGTNTDFFPGSKVIKDPTTGSWYIIDVSNQNNKYIITNPKTLTMTLSSGNISTTDIDISSMQNGTTFAIIGAISSGTQGTTPLTLAMLIS